MILSKALHAVAGGDVAKARYPKGQGVDQGFTQDDLGTGLECRKVPHPAMRAGQVQMFRRPRSQIIPALAAVDFDHLALRVKDGHDQRAVEVLVTALPINPDRHQPTAQLGPSFPVLCR